MLYGMSLLYGLSGSTLLSDIAVTVGSGDTSPIVTLAVVLLIVGFGFKVSAVPFHPWAPDVYEGAPTTTTEVLLARSQGPSSVALLQLAHIAYTGRTDLDGPHTRVISPHTPTVTNIL